MKRFNPVPWLAAVLLTLAVGCARQNQSEAAMSAESASAADAEAVSASAPASAGAEKAPIEAVEEPGVDADQLVSSANTATDPRRRFVRTASAQFQVKDVYASTLAIEDTVASEGGFVVKNTVSARVMDQRERAIGDGKLLQLSRVATHGSMVVRVPSERTQTFLRTIARQMQFLDERTFEASDVQFDLLRRQLAFQRAQELQRDIRDATAQPAKTGDKVDAVQAREQMLAARDEATVGERELEDRIAFSTLTLELEQPPTVREQTVPDTDAILRERGSGFFSRIGDGIVAGWRGLLEVLVAAASVWPLWLVLAAASWLARRLRKGRVSHKAQAAAPPPL